MTLSLTSLHATPNDNTKPLVLGSINTTTGKIAGQIIVEAYRRIGIEVQLKLYPAARSLALASQGKIDGEVIRILDLQKNHPSLLRVPTSFFSLKAKIFKIDKNIKVEKVEDLANYKSGVLHGILYGERLTQFYPHIKVQSISQLFRMLLNGRQDIDLAIVTELSGSEVLAREFPNSVIVMDDVVLSQHPVYHYLHQSNQKILPSINHSLSEMLKEGKVQKMLDHFLSELGKPIP
ncbi:MAG: transporter substrate-binding domain-containing protein [Bermanella sp.]